MGLASWIAAAALAAAPRISAAATDGEPYVPTDQELFDWAERTYPALFPTGKVSQRFEQYVYRHYPETANYVGIARGGAYILGPVANSAVTPVYVGQVADFACQVKPERCTNGRLPGSRIGIRPVADGSPFYDRQTGAVFVPRGFNYVRLARLTKFWGGEEAAAHATFNVGHYDANAADAALGQMAGLGYNVVRVFLSVCCAGTLSDPSHVLSEPYLKNLADFIGRAKSHGISVIVTSDGWLPVGYPRTPADSAYELINMVYLSTAGVEGSKAMWSDLVTGLRRLGAPLDNVLAYSVANEAFAGMAEAPFNRSTGSITTANGRTYSLGDAESRRTMVDEGLLHFGNEVRSAIRAVDPTALVTMGVLARNEPHVFMPGDTRLAPRLFPAFATSTLDFIDMHPYPVFSITFEQQMANYGLTGRSPIPLLMGEFGELHQRKATSALAAVSLRDWQRLSCRFGFVGWLLWTWDTAEQGAGEWWSGRDEGGAIARALSPAERPDPCN